MSLATFDFILLALAALFALLSLRHGILYEIASIASWILAIFIAKAGFSFISDTVNNILNVLFPQADLTTLATTAPILSFILLLILSFIAIAFILRRIITFPTKNSNFKLLERTFGGIILGLAKTYTLAALFLLFYQYASLPLGLDIEPPFLVDSFSYYHIESFSIIILDFALTYL